MAQQEDLVFALKARDQASSTFAQVQKSSGQSSKAVKTHWSNISKNVGKAFTGMGVAMTGAFGLAAKTAADFESSMREVNTMMGQGEEDFAAFSDQVKNMASDMGVDAVESAQALYQAISAGVPKENAVEFLQVATKAAIGGVTDTATAVDGLTSVMNAFKIPVEEADSVADTMFTTVKNGKTTFDELSASMFNVAPLAAAAGVKFDTVAASLSTLTKQGVPTAQATTQLRAAIQAVIKPTEDMKEALTELGYESGDALIAQEGLAGAFDILREQAGGSNEVLGKMFGSVEGLQAVLSLTGENAESFAADMDQVANSGGAAQAAYEEMERSLDRQMTAMKEQFDALVITIGEAFIPVLKDILDAVKPVIDAIVGWMQENPELAKTIVVVAGAVGAAMAVLGPLLILLPSLISALPILGAAFVALTGPVGIIVAAIAGAIAIGVLLWKNWDTIKEKALAIFGAIADFFRHIWGVITDIFRVGWEIAMAIMFPHKTVLNMVIENWEPIVDFFTNLWDRVTGAFRKGWDAITGVVKGAINSIIGLENLMIAGMENALNFIGDAIRRMPSFELPSWIPGLGGKGFSLPAPPHINLPRIPTLDTGGVVRGPGLFAVGPGVREIVREPGTGDIYVTGNTFIIREEADVRKVAKELRRLEQMKRMEKGLSFAV